MLHILDKILALLGPKGVLVEGRSTRATDGWGAQECLAPAIIRPTNTKELSEVMKLCYAQGQKVVTHG